MFSWLKRLTRRVEQSAPPSPAVQLTASVTIKVGPDKRAAVFNTAAVRQLWDRVREISHPDFPFLHAGYSPGSNMPCADFTLWIADRLAADDWAAISELLSFMTYEHELKALRRTMQSFEFGQFVEADVRLLHTLKAATILAYRIGWMGSESTRIWLLEDIYQHCLALYPFRVQQSAFPRLLSGGARIIRKRNREGVGSVQEMPSAARLTSFPEVSMVAEKLRDYPPTFGACITMSLRWGSPIPGTILARLAGDYTLRQYGLSDAHNAAFFQECGFFEPASDLAALGRKLKKDALLQIATSTQIEVAKSWKKERILALLLESADARAAVAAQASRDFVQYRAAVKAAFDAWQGRVAAVQVLACCLAGA
jgi:hypothetical protein